MSCVAVNKAMVCIEISIVCSPFRENLQRMHAHMSFANILQSMLARPAAQPLSTTQPEA
jgi:hypothetical protein